MAECLSGSGKDTTVNPGLSIHMIKNDRDRDSSLNIGNNIVSISLIWARHLIACSMGYPRVNYFRMVWKCAIMMSCHGNAFPITGSLWGIPNRPKMRSFGVSVVASTSCGTNNKLPLVWDAMNLVWHHSNINVSQIASTEETDCLPPHGIKSHSLYQIQTSAMNPNVISLFRYPLSYRGPIEPKWRKR